MKEYNNILYNVTQEGDILIISFLHNWKINNIIEKTKQKQEKRNYKFIQKKEINNIINKLKDKKQKTILFFSRPPLVKGGHQ